MYICIYIYIYSRSSRQSAHPPETGLDGRSGHVCRVVQEEGMRGIWCVYGLAQLLFANHQVQWVQVSSVVMLRLTLSDTINRLLT